jgi:Raf kinase inhibitor-like YbhB/YbcL family protein
MDQEVAALSIEVTSSAFAEGARIPTRYTCDGEDASPPLKWTGVPQAAKSIALIADDPDAPGGTWIHWVLYGLSPDTTGLPEGLPKTNELLSGARHGVTDFGRNEYGGPCPPPGHGAHRYYFKVYALDAEIGLAAGGTKQDVLEAMKGKILAEGQLMGTYLRE